MFVAKYDTAGNVKWVITSEAQPYRGSTGNSICADNNGNIWVTGWFSDTVKFGNTILTVPYGHYDDVFIAKIVDTSGNFSLSTQKEIIQNSFFSLYPNPANSSLSISCPANTSSLNFEIKNLTGKTILGSTSPAINHKGLCTVDISNLPPGLYFIELVAGGMREVEKFVVVR